MSALRRAEDLYFDDCGLLLQAEDTLFRVSGDLLASQSSFFRDMQSFPVPPDATKIDGLQVVAVPDSAEDMAKFLKAVLLPTFFPPLPAETTWSTLAPILRLSHKYTVDWLLKRAVEHLSATHPTTHADWRLLEQAAEQGNFMLGASTDVCLDAILLARQLRLDWILPMAFYRLARTKDPEAVLASEELPMQDKVRWVVGLRLLDGPWRTNALECFWDPRGIPGCKAKGNCPEMRIGYRMALARRWDNKENQISLPLDIWGEQTWAAITGKPKVPGMVCQVCVEEMKKLKRAADERFWQALPEIFGLGSWAALEAIKARTMA
ncbi:hypothetical protein MKEN_00640000 [Mycena kentingensis (nom. inval.)]|nr:hypothetical protein MKEN_00640000 [Mycena kentingensis (nom. inval.)]